MAELSNPEAAGVLSAVAELVAIWSDEELLFV